MCSFLRTGTGKVRKTENSLRRGRKGGSRCPGILTVVHLSSLLL